MWSLLAPFFAVFSDSILAMLYVQPLPAGHNVVGSPDQTLNISTLIDCVEHLYDNPPRFIAFGNGRCFAYTTAYGIEKSRDLRIKSFALIGGASDENQFNCQQGWIKVDLPDSVVCYRTMTQKQYVVYNNTGTRSAFLDACKRVYPYANAASIHSSEEERQIAKTFANMTALSAQWYGVKIGLRLDNPAEFKDLKKWYWVDGSPRDYQLSFNATELSGYCNSAYKCSHGALYWIGSEVLAGGGDLNQRDLLCKYTLRVK